MTEVNTYSKYISGIDADDVDLIISKIPMSVWNELHGQRIFITGGTGFVGCWILEALLAGDQHFDLGLKLTLITRNIEGFYRKAPHLAGHPAVTLIKCDVTDMSQIEGTFDIIIHAATEVSNQNSDPLKTFHEIVKGTEQTLSLATRAKTKRYLLTSSGAIYGRQPIEYSTLPESYTGAPDTMVAANAYGQAKRISEWMIACHASQHGIETKVARCFALVGPYMPLNSHFAIGNFISDTINGEKVRVSGDGTAYRSYLYAADLAIWLLTILINGKSRAYNIGSSQRITIGELAKKVSELSTGSENIIITEATSLEAHQEQYVPDIKRALDLGLQEYTSLSCAIRKTTAWNKTKITRS